MGFIQDYVVALGASYWVVFIIFLLCYVDGFFPPLPSESILITLGSLAATTGNVYIISVWIFGALGAWLGDVTAYHIARYIPLYRIPFLNKGKGKKAVDAAERSLAERGVFLILVARFVPIGRIAVNMVAGATGYSRMKFIAISCCAASVWSAYSISLGYGAGAILHHSPLLAIFVGIVLGILSGIILDRIITFIGNVLAKRIVNNKIRFLRWIRLEDIINQGIDIDEDTISTALKNDKLHLPAEIEAKLEENSGNDDNHTR
ncbi:DedA family protein [Actinomyces sp. zg-332]|uniref:DedA family protein n=1 Tax=Actinomyces sp. zg-332 TaxID=2708340 RepID=UPI00141EBD7D|nr:DedA family protein [Actinomyces sp. zg-332]QPK94280.1 DedA family protein [Actinomyces sp. zg-332]